MTTISNSAGCDAKSSQPSWATRVGAPDTALDFGDVLVWPREGSDNTQYYFLPLAPLLAAQPNSVPHVGLMDPGGRAFFYATLQLALPSDRIEQLREQLMTENVPMPMLSPAPIDVKSADVVMTESDGTKTTIHTRIPAPHPPHTALLQHSVQGSAKAAIEAALMGNIGHIQLQYQVTRYASVQTIFTVQGCFPKHLTVAQLEGAINRGAVTLSPTPDSSAQRREIFEQVLKFEGLVGGNTKVSVGLTTRKPHSFSIGIDLGRLMMAHMPLNDPLPPI